MDLHMLRSIFWVLVYYVYSLKKNITYKNIIMGTSN